MSSNQIFFLYAIITSGLIKISIINTHEISPATILIRLGEISLAIIFVRLGMDTDKLGSRLWGRYGRFGTLG